MTHYRKKLPEAYKAHEIQRQSTQFDPSLIAMWFGFESKLDIACICLQDACNTANDAIYALQQAHANLLWYREEDPKAPNELTAVFMSRFYADDAALRIYSAGEHMAKFLLDYFNISDAEFKEFAEIKKIKRKPRLEKIACLLQEKFSDSSITKPISNLVHEVSWTETVQYRNDWVHNQPWLIEGMGIVYERKTRWKDSPKKHILIGEGDKPRYTIEKLLEIFTDSLESLVLVLSGCNELFTKTLNDKAKEKGWAFDEELDTYTSPR